MGINHNLKILLVDDMATMRQILKDMLEQMGFNNITMTDDGENAWPIIKKEKFELIICDWNMPQMSGLELLKKVMASDKHKNIPFIMIIPETEKDKVVLAQQAGVKDYLTRPFTYQELQTKIKQIFAA